MTNLNIAKLYLATNATATAAQIDAAITDGSAATAVTALTGTTLLNAIYQAAFGRDADAEGVAYWTSVSLTGDALVSAIMGGAAKYPTTGALAATAANDAIVTAAKAVAEAASDATTIGASAVALVSVVDTTTANVAVETIKVAAYDAALVTYNAAVATHAAAVTTSTAATTAADAAALTVSSVTLANASLTAANAAKTAADAVATAAAAMVTAAATLTTKAAATPSVIDDSTAATNTATANTANTAATTSATAAAALVTTATTAVATAQAAADAAAAAGSTFTLTDSADVIFGTAKSDTITGTVDVYTAGTTHAGTLNTSDVIADSSSVDNDILTITASDDINDTPSVVGIENVNFNLAAFTTSTTATNDTAAATWDVNADNISAGTLTLDNTQTGSTLATAAVTGVKSGMTVAFSSDFTTSSVAAITDADVTINVAAANTLTQTGAADDLTVNSTFSAAAYTTANDLNVTAAATDNVTITAVSDVLVASATAATKTVTVTSTGGAVEFTDVDSALTVVATAKDEVTMAASAAEVATSLTISAADNGTYTAATDSYANTTVLDAAIATTLNISGNGAKITASVVDVDVLNTINISGTESVTVVASAADIDALIAGTGDIITVTDTSTAGTSMLTLGTAAGNVDARAVDTDVIINMAVANATKALTVASGATVNLEVSQTTSSSTADITATYATRATNVLNLTVNNHNTADNTITLTDQVISNVATVNIDLVDSLTTATSYNLGTAAVVVTQSDSDAVLTLAGATTAGSIDASAMTGVVTADLQGTTTLKTLTTGSGNDVITVTTAALTSGGYTLTTGAGNDSITMAGGAASVNNYTINGGDGTDTVGFVLTTDLSGKTFSLTNVEVLDLDTSGDAASTITIDGDQLNGKSLVVTATDNTTGDVLDVTVNAATLDLSGLNVNATDVSVTIDANSYTAVAATSIIGTNADDTVTINGGVGSSATTGAGNDNVTGGAGADTISTGAGADTVAAAAGNNIVNLGDSSATTTDTVTATTGNDTITQGEGKSSITAGVGSNTINVTETVAAEDTIILTTATAATDYETITGFDFGGAATDDDIQLSFGHASMSNLINGTGDTAISTDAMDAVEVSAATTLVAQEMVILTGATFTNLSAVETAIEVGGTHALTFANATSADDDFLVMWSNGTDSFISSMNLHTAGTTIAVDSITESTDIVKFVGVNASVVGTVADADFDAFIA